MILKNDAVSDTIPMTWDQYLTSNCKLVETVEDVKHYTDGHGHYIVIGEAVQIDYGSAGIELFKAVLACKRERAVTSYVSR